MASRLPLLIFRLAILVALGVSSALLIDYFRPLPAFCDVGSGCDKVRASGYGSVFGVPLPLLGVLGFALLMAVSLRKSEQAHHFTRILALVAGVSGVLLLLTQALVVKVFCKLCIVVDSAAIVAGLAALVARPP